MSSRTARKRKRYGLAPLPEARVTFVEAGPTMQAEDLWLLGAISTEFFEEIQAAKGQPSAALTVTKVDRERGIVTLVPAGKDA